ADFLGEKYAGNGLLPEVIATLAEILFAPATEGGLLREAVVESEKNNLRDAIRATVNDPRAYALSHCRKLLCRGEPYAVSLIGKECDVDAITAAGLTQRHRTFVNDHKPVFFYVGATSPETVAALLDKHFGALGGTLPTYSTSVLPQVSEIRRSQEQMPLCQDKLAIGFRTDVSITHPLAPATVLMNEIFGGSPASKLFLNVREKRSLCYHCSSSLDLYKGVLFAQSGMRSENREITEQAIFEEFDALQRGEITARELEAARSSLKHSYTQLYDNAAAMADFYLNRVVAGGSDSIESWRERIAAVTLDQIVQAAQHVRPGAVFFVNGTMDGEVDE
ncbi:MAG: insulinase family protein, partial [Clostridia bacterium]|nr:insulinase family protein [Clostridia bacterium]